MQGNGYVGRFAPTPSGPLHFGSLIAATGSYLDARANGGRWQLRIDDLDRPRAEPGAADHIQRTLAAYGFDWDGPVVYQSQRIPAYTEALEQLLEAGHVFPCGCTRKEIREHGLAGPQGPVYPGTCRDGLPPGKAPRAMRLRTHAETIRFTDRLQGEIRQTLTREIGDFVVRRADDIFAYHLAVVVDDAWQGVTDVVRGVDLIDSTPAQIYLQFLLGLPTPRYLHLPVATNAGGQKLSKQNLAPPIPDHDPLPNLVQTLVFLAQDPPLELLEGTLLEFWQWAIDHWDPGRLPRTREIRCPTD